MNYALVTKDYGQGEGMTVLPVSKNSRKYHPNLNKAYSAYEVLTTFFEEDMGLVLNNYINLEFETIKKYGVMSKAKIENDRQSKEGDVRISSNSDCNDFLYITTNGTCSGTRNKHSTII